MRARAFLRGVTPPYFVAAARNVRSRDRRPPHRWEYVGTAWVNGDADGWNAESVSGHYARKLDTFRAAIAAPSCIGVATEALLGCTASQYDQNIALGYAYAVARAASGRKQVSILDWGGGFGFMAFLTRELFPELQIDFHVKEVPPTASEARKHVEDVTFWDDDTCLDRSYDLVSACASLQYSPDWRTDLARFAAATPFLLLTRVPVAMTPNSFVVRQHAYGTSYSGWVFSRSELLSAADAAGLLLERELLEGWSAGVPGAPARDEARGYLFSSSRAISVDHH
jgi:putative methyltransferase (TIGR04325 family)